MGNLSISIGVMIPFSILFSILLKNHPQLKKIKITAKLIIISLITNVSTVFILEILSVSQYLNNIVNGLLMAITTGLIGCYFTKHNT